MTFTDAVELILKEEAGYVNNPDDPGGETNFGISKRSYPDKDIANLTRDEAIAIYRVDYWDACRCGELPSGADLLVFDSAVNQGVNRAIRILQNSVGVNGDGVIGPLTIQAAQSINLDELVARRLEAYSKIPQVVTFGLGWFRRVVRMAHIAFDSKGTR